MGLRPSPRPIPCAEEVRGKYGGEEKKELWRRPPNWPPKNFGETLVWVILILVLVVLVLRLVNLVGRIFF